MILALYAGQAGTVGAAPQQWRRGGKKVWLEMGGGQKGAFFDRQISDGGDMGAQKFYFSPEFYANGSFCLRCCICKKKILTMQKQFSDRLKFRGRGIVPLSLATTSLCGCPAHCFEYLEILKK